MLTSASWALGEVRRVLGRCLKVLKSVWRWLRGAWGGGCTVRGGEDEVALDASARARWWLGRGEGEARLAAGVLLGLCSGCRCTRQRRGGAVETSDEGGLERRATRCGGGALPLERGFQPRPCLALSSFSL